MAWLIEFKNVAPLANRAPDVIVRAGAHILLTEVERALIAHPMVLDAAAFGVPDPMLGQRVAAVVQLKSEGDDAIIDKILATAGMHLPEHNLPDLLTVVDAVPRDPFGNIDREAIAQAVLGIPIHANEK
ncbi:acyl-CoA synthetase (AMP-forming)/AMP-acid ligase II [Bradyrhizobium sp. JR7.2]|jgi:acyl-CoA synthetase (AMP-forming)/AMP-acid ligase II|uniref:Acyl--CoA ligase n=1 Tax=Bradyrhizobium barranii TaxID=2992140 RepID=A0ABY3R2R3_9BRAD|nr:MULTISPECIES: class I adenylate-forming enzyme family protein [Bradyrhizobium]UFW91786.1 acyl--CoA ligase [Bradyrhizobium japonicum]WFU00311.1 class I adenylate-forming enzyme family protein [Bradyrhizobium barranii]CUT16647.1 acylCoA synthase CDS [Bradyrhizobium sp.]